MNRWEDSRTPGRTTLYIGNVPEEKVSELRDYLEGEGVDAEQGQHYTIRDDRPANAPLRAKNDDPIMGIYSDLLGDEVHHYGVETIVSVLENFDQKHLDSMERALEEEEN